MEATLIYCYDAYCGWCYGFSTVFQSIQANFNNRLNVEVLSGGMILPANPVHISATAAYIRQAYPQVEAVTGAVFGKDYLWHINHPDESDWFPYSEKPAVALCVFKDYYPEEQVQFATSLQHALFAEGRDLCDDEAYREILSEFNLPEGEFYEKLHSAPYKENAYDEFALVKQLQVTGYPCVLLQVTDTKFYLVSNGYTRYEELEQNITVVLKEASVAKP